MDQEDVAVEADGISISAETVTAKDQAINEVPARASVSAPPPHELDDVELYTYKKPTKKNVSNTQFEEKLLDVLKPADYDECNYFCFTLGKEMHVFTPQQRSIAKMCISQIMHEVRWGSISNQPTPTATVPMMPSQVINQAQAPPAYAFEDVPGPQGPTAERVADMHVMQNIPNMCGFQ